MPDVELPSMVIALKHFDLTAEQLGRKMRTGTKPSIIGRIQKDDFIIDLRTVTKEEERTLLNALCSI